MLSEVLAASSTYGDGNHVQPYQKDLVSWAPAGFVPVPIEQALSETDREWFGQWATHLLVPPAEAAAAAAESGLERPHMDPQLAHNANTYGDFLRRLHEAGMLRWKRTEQACKGSLGVFFVAKTEWISQNLFVTRLAIFLFYGPVIMRATLCPLRVAH